MCYRHTVWLVEIGAGTALNTYMHSNSSVMLQMLENLILVTFRQGVDHRRLLLSVSYR